MISSLNTIVSSKFAEMKDGKICDAINGILDDRGFRSQRTIMKTNMINVEFSNHRTTNILNVNSSFILTLF